MDQSSSNKTWYIISAVVIVAFAAWYFYPTQSSTIDTQPSAIENNQAAPVSEGNTTADIQADLNQTLDDSAALDQDAAASAQAVQGL